jgi:hypothetical protein
VPGVELVHDPRVMFLFRRTSFVSRSTLLVSWLACLDRFPLFSKLFPSFPARLFPPVSRLFPSCIQRSFPLSFPSCFLLCFPFVCWLHIPKDMFPKHRELMIAWGVYRTFQIHLNMMRVHYLFVPLFLMFFVKLIFPNVSSII